MCEEPILMTISSADTLVEYRLETPCHERVIVLTLVFEGTSGRKALRFTNPWPLDATFALTENHGDVVLRDISSHQLDTKKVKVEFSTEIGEEFWAERVEFL